MERVKAICNVCAPARAGHRGAALSYVLALVLCAASVPVGTVRADSLALVGATIIDGTGAKPLESGVLLMENGRIIAVGRKGDLRLPQGTRTVDITGRYVIPGLMDANVHLFSGYFVEFLARYEGRYEEIIEEAAQIALKNGVTSVFDSWGPLQPLVTVRHRINAGLVPGARLFVAGNIVGFDGPLSNDFNRAAQTSVSSAFKARINSLWEENVGARLMYMTPDQVRTEIRKYIARGIDFLKYGASGHNLEEARFVGFSPAAQRAIVEEAHAAGIIVQTHTMNVESVRLAIEAGVDILQHCEATGPILLPASTIQLMISREVHCSVLPRTRTRLAIEGKSYTVGSPLEQNANSMNLNVNALIAAQAPIVMSTDALFWPKDIAADAPPQAQVEVSTALGEGHFLWLQAMNERSFPPMRALQAATRDVAAAYGKLDELGTLEVGKAADAVVLDANPLVEVRNYRKISMVVKAGRIIDRAALPVTPRLTASSAATATSDK